MATRDTKLKIIVDAENRAARGLADTKRSLDGMSGSAEKLSSTLRSMGKVGAVAFTALSAASAKLINDSAQSLQIEESYRRMTAQAKISSEELLQQLRETSAGTVSSTNLMLSANRAMALGVAEDMETVTTLMEIARLKGRALGLDTTQAFNDIVTGIGRGSPLILDNLGITIKLGEAQEMYAEKLGKTAAELSDAEKKQALLNAVMESGRAELAAAGEVNKTAAENIQTLKAQLADTADEIGRALIPAAQELLAAVQPIIERVAEWVKENPKLTATIVGIALAATALLVVLGAIGLAIPAVVAAFAIFTGTGGVIIATLAAIGFAVSQIIGIIDLLKNHWDDTWLGIKLITANAVNSVISVIESMINFVIESLNKFINKINRVIKAAASLTGISIPTIGTLDTISLGRVDTEALVQRDLDARQPVNVVVTGNTLLSEDAAEEIGDQIMGRLKLSNAI